MIKTLDRYILRSFVVNYLILGLALMGLIILIDVILNLDEFADGASTMYGPDSGVLGMVRLAVAFYGPRSLLIFVYLSGLLPLGAAGFTLVQMSRTREITAIVASGVSLYRVAMPLLVAGGISSLVLFVNQQLLIPPHAAGLSQTSAELDKGITPSMRFYFVPDGQDRLFSGMSYDEGTQTMTGVRVLVRGEHRQAVQHIYADSATWDESRRAWRLVDGRQVVHQVETAGTGQSLSRTEPIEYLPTDLDPTTLVARQRARYRPLLGLAQLASLMDKPQIVDTKELTRILHSRFSLPVINVLILAIGLPFFLMRSPRNVVVQSIKAAAWCLPIWGGGFLMLLISPGGIPPALVAWLPVAIYLPIAWYQMERLET